MGDIRKNIENKAEEANVGSGDQHLGDAMDDAEPEGASEQAEAEKKRRLA